GHDACALVLELLVGAPRPGDAGGHHLPVPGRLRRPVPRRGLCLPTPAPARHDGRRRADVPRPGRGCGPEVGRPWPRCTVPDHPRRDDRLAGAGRDRCGPDRLAARAARGRPGRSGVGGCLGYVGPRRVARSVSMSETPQDRGRHRLSRRGLLAGGAAVLAAGVVGTPVLAGWRGQSSTGTVLASRIPLPVPFGWPLTVPPALAPL